MPQESKSPQARAGLYTRAHLESLSPEDRIRRFLKASFSDDERFDSRFHDQSDIRLVGIDRISPHKTVVTFAFTVDRFYCNRSGNLHGGAQATIFDVYTSVAMQAISGKSTWLNGGVSRSISTTYLRPAPEGTKLLMECEIVQMGRTTAMLRGLLKRESDGAVISTCEHDKAAIANKAGWDTPTPAPSKSKI